MASSLQSITSLFTDGNKSSNGCLGKVSISLPLERIKAECEAGEEAWSEGKLRVVYIGGLQDRLFSDLSTGLFPPATTSTAFSPLFDATRLDRYGSPDFSSSSSSIAMASSPSSPAQYALPLTSSSQTPKSDSSGSKSDSDSDPDFSALLIPSNHLSPLFARDFTNDMFGLKPLPPPASPTVMFSKSGPPGKGNSAWADVLVFRLSESASQIMVQGTTIERNAIEIARDAVRFHLARFLGVPNPPPVSLPSTEKISSPWTSSQQQLLSPDRYGGRKSDSEPVYSKARGNMLFGRNTSIPSDATTDDAQGYQDHQNRKGSHGSGSDLAHLFSSNRQHQCNTSEVSLASSPTSSSIVDDDELSESQSTSQDLSSSSSPPSITTWNKISDTNKDLASGSLTSSKPQACRETNILAPPSSYQDENRPKQISIDTNLYLPKSRDSSPTSSSVVGSSGSDGGGKSTRATTPDEKRRIEGNANGISGTVLPIVKETVASLSSSSATTQFGETNNPFMPSVKVHDGLNSCSVAAPSYYFQTSSDTTNGSTIETPTGTGTRTVADGGGNSDGDGSGSPEFKILGARRFTVSKAGRVKAIESKMEGAASNSPCNRMVWELFKGVEADMSALAGLDETLDRDMEGSKENQMKVEIADDVSYQKSQSNQQAEEEEEELDGGELSRQPLKVILVLSKEIAAHDNVGQLVDFVQQLGTATTTSELLTFFGHHQTSPANSDTADDDDDDDDDGNQDEFKKDNKPKNTSSSASTSASIDSNLTSAGRKVEISVVVEGNENGEEETAEKVRELVNDTRLEVAEKWCFGDIY